MNEEQFSKLIEKLDWIGYSLERLIEQNQENFAYPRQVEVVERRR